MSTGFSNLIQSWQLIGRSFRKLLVRGEVVEITEKQKQPTGKLIEGIVARILTSSPTHPHGHQGDAGGRQGGAGAGDRGIMRLLLLPIIDFRAGK